MSEPVRVALVGATGLVGRSVIDAMVGRDDVRLMALARREIPLPRGARMELLLAPAGEWEEILGQIRPDCVICALGTTWAKADKDEEGFRAVDQKLVLAVARAALAAGARQFILVSSAGADIMAKGIYLQVKGEVERDLGKLGFRRFDILQPGLLRGSREDDPRPLERMGQFLAPLMKLLLAGKWRKYRPIEARVLARAALSLTRERPGGRFVHDYDAIRRAAGKWISA